MLDNILSELRLVAQDAATLGTPAAASLKADLDALIAAHTGTAVTATPVAPATPAPVADIDEDDELDIDDDPTERVAILGALGINVLGIDRGPAVDVPVAAAPPVPLDIEDRYDWDDDEDYNYVPVTDFAATYTKVDGVPFTKAELASTLDAMAFTLASFGEVAIVTNLTEVLADNDGKAVIVYRVTPVDEYAEERPALNLDNMLGARSSFGFIPVENVGTVGFSMDALDPETNLPRVIAENDGDEDVDLDGEYDGLDEDATPAPTGFVATFVKDDGSELTGPQLEIIIEFAGHSLASIGEVAVTNVDQSNAAGGIARVAYDVTVPRDDDASVSTSQLAAGVAQWRGTLPIPGVGVVSASAEMNTVYVDDVS